MDPNQAQPNLQEPPTPQFNTPDSLHWLKILSISLLAILVLSIVGIGAYFLGKGSAKPQQISTIATPTPDLNREPTGSAATANWKTYFNSKYGYYIKYPPTSKLDDKNSYKIWVDNQISIGVLSNPTNCLECPIIKKTENVNINGNPAKKTAGELTRGISYVDQSFMEYEIIHNNNHYYIKLYELSDDAARALYLTPDRIPKEIPQDKIQLFEQIASTFRFE